MINLFLVLWSTFSWAGFETHGGSAMVCRNDDKTIKSVELLDSYEGKYRYGLNLLSETATEAEVFSQAFEKLKPYPFVLQRVQKLIPYFKKVTVRLPDGHQLVKVEDIVPVVIEDGCEIEQMAVYDSQGVFLIRESLFDKMSARDQTALFLHEALFAIARFDLHAKQSTGARYLTAILLSSTLPAHDVELVSSVVKSMSLSGPEGEYVSRMSTTCKLDVPSNSISIRYDTYLDRYVLSVKDGRICYGEKLIENISEDTLEYDAKTNLWNSKTGKTGNWTLREESQRLLFTSLNWGPFFRTTL